MIPRPKRIECCKELTEELKADTLICLLYKVPFTRTPSAPTIYIMSDGGHGGMTQIHYCPFCGKKIKFEGDTEEK